MWVKAGKAFLDESDFAEPDDMNPATCTPFVEQPAARLYYTAQRNTILHGCTDGVSVLREQQGSLLDPDAPGGFDITTEPEGFCRCPLTGDCVFADAPLGVSFDSSSSTLTASLSKDESSAESTFFNATVHFSVGSGVPYAVRDDAQDLPQWRVLNAVVPGWLAGSALSGVANLADDYSPELRRWRAKAPLAIGSEGLAESSRPYTAVVSSARPSH